MTIPHNVDRHAFTQTLNSALSPSRPIDTIEHLHGRDTEREELEKALAMEGRHAFIYGDRGVGKSSLAATVAALLQSSDGAPISVAGSPDETFSSIIRNIVIQATGTSRLERKQVDQEVHAGLSQLGGRRNTTIEVRDLGASQFTIAEAADILRAAGERHSTNPVVVIDEFDRIGDKRERSKFADLLKHLGDAKISIKLLFTGVGNSLDDLLGAHASAIRQLHTKELTRLSFDGRWDIAIDAAAAFGIGIPKDIYIRIAQISDGYPYYVHLMMEKILWRAYEEPDDVSEITWDLFHIGLRDAIASINVDLKRPYDVVLRQRSRDYEPVLWATADGDELFRSIQSYYHSYDQVMRQLEREPLNAAQFRRRVQRLLSDELGVLKKDWYVPGNYTYRENMLRGYVRMQAEANDVELYGEEVQANRPVMHVPARASVGYHGPTIPSGVAFKGERRRRRKD